MGTWERSWAITRTTFRLIGKDQEMLWFPVLAGFFSLLFSAALLVPTFVLQVAGQTAGAHLVVGPLQYIALFASYFGLSSIATFFNVCVVNTVRVRLSGGDATFMDSIRFALSRLHLIVAWSLVSASVGIFLHALEQVAERLGFAGKLLMWILRAVLASAWSIATIFVIPGMVYKGLGPLDAIGDSLATLKRTWGESLVRYYGLGLASIVCVGGCVMVILGGIFVATSVPVVGISIISLGGLGLLAVALLFGVATTVFNTVLYDWATNGTVCEGVDPSMLSGAMRVRTR